MSVLDITDFRDRDLRDLAEQLFNGETENRYIKLGDTFYSNLVRQFKSKFGFSDSDLVDPVDDMVKLYLTYEVACDACIEKIDTLTALANTGEVVALNEWKSKQTLYCKMATRYRDMIDVGMLIGDDVIGCGLSSVEATRVG